jgi:hypothetical protein
MPKDDRNMTRSAGAVNRKRAGHDWPLPTAKTWSRQVDAVGYSYAGSETAAQTVMYNGHIVLRRTQIYLDDWQLRELHRAAERTGQTVSALIREAIDARFARTSNEDFLKALRTGAFGVWRQRLDLGLTETYVRRVRRGSRINRLVA